MQLSSGDVCRIAGVYQVMLDRWVTTGMLTPTTNGRGTGNHRRFSLMQCVAVAYGRQWQAIGSGVPLVATVVEFVANLDEAEMLERFEEGKTVVFPVPESPIWYDPSNEEEETEVLQAINLQACYHRVKQAVAERNGLAHGSKE